MCKFRLSYTILKIFRLLFISLTLLYCSCPISIEEDKEESKTVKTPPPPIIDIPSLTANPIISKNTPVRVQGIYYRLRFDGRPMKFSFKLRGKPALGIWPQFALIIGEQEIYRVTVDTAEWKNYSIIYTPPADTEVLALKLMNDYYNPTTGEDRNLYCKEFTIEPVSQPDEGGN
ncbi:hypothetical protein J7M23_07570 [Candidatus Sumerlaeota bacterium]|nr:hypothetical protein [Candidatus Sumerlaeota bacterium]